MRDVLRTVFEGALGPDWLDKIGKKAREGIAKAAELAHRQRPDEKLRDDWDAAGVNEIAAALRTVWDDLGGAMGGVWKTLTHAIVDLDRLSEFRGKELHQVGEPPGPGTIEEMSGVIYATAHGVRGGPPPNIR